MFIFEEEEKTKERCEKEKGQKSILLCATLQTPKSFKSQMIDSRHEYSLACETFYVLSLSLPTPLFNYFCFVH